MDRRKFLKGLAASPLLGSPWSLTAAPTQLQRPHTPADVLPVAGVVTVYKKNSHADVLLGKILNGWRQQGGPGPKLKLVGLYVDQFPRGDLSRQLMQQHGVPIYDSIEGALTGRSGHIDVAGVLSIGEHGDYPSTPDTNQRMYPRRRFFDQITRVFQQHDQVIPVFNDKHLSFNWADALAMYTTAQQMRIPFLAGSSIPVAWRTPEVEIPVGSQLQSALGVGYGGSESYGFHMLEGLQCFVERRAGGETGVRSVQAVQGSELMAARETGFWSSQQLLAVLQAGGKPVRENWEQVLEQRGTGFLIEYRDGLKAAAILANGLTEQFGVAAQVVGQDRPVACQLTLELNQPYGHFAWLLRAIEQLVHSKTAPYQVERTLLTTGILDRAMHSLAAGSKRLATPELDVRYQPSDWGFAPAPVGSIPQPLAADRQNAGAFRYGKLAPS